VSSGGEGSGAVAAGCLCDDVERGGGRRGVVEPSVVEPRLDELGEDGGGRQAGPAQLVESTYEEGGRRVGFAPREAK